MNEHVLTFDVAVPNPAWLHLTDVSKAKFTELVNNMQDDPQS